MARQAHGLYTANGSSIGWNWKGLHAPDETTSDFEKLLGYWSICTLYPKLTANIYSIYLNFVSCYATFDPDFPVS